MSGKQINATLIGRDFIDVPPGENCLWAPEVKVRRGWTIDIRVNGEVRGQRTVIGHEVLSPTCLRLYLEPLS